MSKETFKAYCATCKAADDCRRAFGKFHHEKSNGGVGCDFPFPGYDRQTKEPPTMFNANHKTRKR